MDSFKFFLDIKCLEVPKTFITKHAIFIVTDCENEAFADNKTDFEMIYHHVNVFCELIVLHISVVDSIFPEYSIPSS